MQQYVTTEPVIVYSGSTSEVIPSETTVYLTNQNKKNLIVTYKNRKWKTQKKYFSSFVSKNNYQDVKKYNYSNSNSSNYNSYKSSSSQSSSSGTVNVKGYYRKNGTYVKPHTRSAPSRRK
ncbi:hypothetical protein [Empedobacter brevis]|uniref:hypothetical protein n=1 Tax=Empedobacter brevis TaxID=247 RepID=UPI003340C211